MRATSAVNKRMFAVTGGAHQRNSEQHWLRLCVRKLFAEGSSKASLPLSDLWCLIRFPLIAICEDDTDNMAPILESSSERLIRNM